MPSITLTIGMLTEIRDRARAAEEVAMNFGNDGDVAYAQGVGDVVGLLITGGVNHPSLAASNSQLHTVLRAGRLFGDDLPEDDPDLRYPRIEA